MRSTPGKLLFCSVSDVETVYFHRCNVRWSKTTRNLQCGHFYDCHLKEKVPTGRDQCPIITCAFCFPSDWQYLWHFTSIVKRKRKTFWEGDVFFKYECVINKKSGHFFLLLKIWLILNLKNLSQILNKLAQTPAAVEGKRDENTWINGFCQPITTSESLSLILHQSGFRVICNLRIIFLTVLDKTKKIVFLYV